MTDIAMTTAAEIAARYGCTVAPGCVVQQIPRGQSGLTQFVWDGHGLVTRENATIPRGERNTGSEKIKAARNKAIAARRKQAALARAGMRDDVIALHNRGLSPHQMVQHGVKPDMAKAVLAAAGIEPHTFRPKSEVMSENTEIVDAVRKCAAEGLGVDRTSKRLGIGEHAVKYIMKAHGIVRSVMPPQNDAPAVKRTGCPAGSQREARRVALCAAIVEDHASGLGWHDICAKHGITTHSLGMLNMHRGLGLVCPPRPQKKDAGAKTPRKVRAAESKAARDAAKAERLAKMIALRREGRTNAEIAEAVGLSAGYVSDRLSSAGEPTNVEIMRETIKMARAAYDEERRKRRADRIDALRAMPKPMPTLRALSALFGVSASILCDDLRIMRETAQ